MADFPEAGDWVREADEGRVLGADLEAVLRQMPAGVVVAEAPSGRVILCNRQMEAIWRRPFPSSPDVASYGAWGGFHPDGRPYEAGEWPLARSLLHGEAVEGEEIEVERGDGTRGVVRVNSAPIRDTEGRILRAVLTAFDVTEQRRVEWARALLADVTTTLGASLDFETTLRNVVRLVVPSLADWCSLDLLREDGAIQRLAVEHVDPEKAERVREVARRYPPDPRAAEGAARVMRTGRSELLGEVSDELLRRIAQDEEHLAQLRAIGMRSAMLVPLRARGRTLGVLSFISAESGRRFGEEDLALAEEVAQRAAMAIDNARLYQESQVANRAKSDFLAVISHELRTPLTAIIGYSELLGLGVPEPLTERQHEQVERIEVSAHHLLHLIEEILGLVSLEAGKTRPLRERVRVSDLLRRAQVITQPLAEAAGLAFEVASPPEEIVVETDPDRFVQVLLNLLSNAVKFTDQGTIWLEARRAGDELHVEVRDTGMGLTEEERSHIFDPFWQAEQPITRRAGGTGMGLTITQRLLAVLGGRVEVESQPGTGSTFRVRLPLHARDDAPREADR